MPVAVDAVTLRLLGVAFKHNVCAPNAIALITGKSLTITATALDGNKLHPAVPPPLLITT